MADSSKTYTDRILSITGTAIAIAALGLSIWNGHASQYHNRLSVKPRLFIIPQRTDQFPQLGLFLSNKGAGPALVRSWTISLDDKPVGSWNSGWLGVRNGMKWDNKLPVYFSSATVLQAGESQSIFWISQDQWKGLLEPDRQTFNQTLSRIKVVIEYASVYEEPDKCEFDGPHQWILQAPTPQVK